jgi:hypothetical protein
MFDFSSSGAAVTGTHDAHNCRVIDVEAPGNARQVFLFDVPYPNNLAGI